MVKGEGVSMPRLSSTERKLQTTGTSSSFDETGISTSLFKLQTADNPCSRPQKMSKLKCIHITLFPGFQESRSPASSPWTLYPV